jgi:diketogulonate reductase-like aldo/keto reductase
MINSDQLFPIGIGSWGIGGFAERDSSIDEGKQVDALVFMLESGMNFVEVNFCYSQGYSAEIIAKAIEKSSKSREDLFICQAIYLKDDKDLETSKDEISKFSDLFGSGYVDTLQFSMGSFHRASFEEITDWIDELLDSNKTRFTSLTNGNLEFLKRYHEKYGSKFFSHEVVFNFEVRENEVLGIIPYANEHKIKTVVYQPLRRNRTAALNWEPIVQLSKKYGKTQNQILLNWIVSKGYLPITKSENINHIKEHLDSLSFEMEQGDLDLVNNFKIPNYKSPQIDWDKSGVGVTIDQLSNVFEEEYRKQNLSITQ